MSTLAMYDASFLLLAVLYYYFSDHYASSSTLTPLHTALRLELTQWVSGKNCSIRKPSKGSMPRYQNNIIHRIDGYS